MIKRICLLGGCLLVFAGLSFAERGVLRVKTYPGPVALFAQVKFHGPSGENILQGGENGQFVIFVENRGPGDAFNVEVYITAEKRASGLSFDRDGPAAPPGTHEVGGAGSRGTGNGASFLSGKPRPVGGELHKRVPLGTIEAGKGMKREVGVRAEENIPAGRVSFEIEARAENGRASPVKLAVRTETSETPASAIDDVDRAIPLGEKAGKYDVGVIIGNRNYASSGVADVEYAVRDARVMREYLVKTLGYDRATIIYAEDVTLAKFNEIFGSDRGYKGKLYNYVKPGVSRVFIYYSGHGAPDLESHEAYFFPVDGSPAYIRANGYPLQTFYDNLSRLPAKKITVVLDTCFSGNFQKGSLFQNISPALVKVKKEYQGPPDATILLSAAPDQVAAWYPEKGHSLFTYYFLKGLQGQADLNGDRRITVEEIKAYLMEHVPYMSRRLSGVEQHPVIKGDGNEVIAILKK